MKQIRIIVFLFFINVCHQAMSQQRESFFLDVVSPDRDQVFDKILQSFMGSDYFVQSTDKDAGIIQCKRVVNDKRWISSTKGNVLEYNILLVPLDSEKIRIYLHGNLTQKKLTDSGYHNDDIGIVYDQKHYTPLLEFLQQQLEKE